MEKELKNIFVFKTLSKFYQVSKCANVDTFDDVIKKISCQQKLCIDFKRLVASSAAIHSHEVRK